MRLIIAARQSVLARIQAFMVGEGLRRAHPQLELSYAFRESLGDRFQHDPLWRMPEKGVFTQDFHADLLAGRCDLVVHSWKDLPIEASGGTLIAATMPRADMRDLLLLRNDAWEDGRKGRVRFLTSSPRRVYNLEPFLREALPFAVESLEFMPVRGNIQTRIRKIREQDAHGLIVAKAALDRLLSAERPEFAGTRDEVRRAIDGCRWMILPLSANPAAAAQGAIAVEVAEGRPEILDLLAPIHCAGTFAAVTREREILRGYGGGCHQKIGVSVLERPYGEIVFLRGLTDDERRLEPTTLTPRRPRPPKISRVEMWPLTRSESDWFEREAVEPDIPAEATALWVAKADAWPAGWESDSSRLVWASGRQTWRRLADRGIWVNGCADGLGEQESPHLETLAGRDLRWIKLSHEEGYGETGMPLMPGYRLRPHNHPPDLTGKRYFYWTSGSGFHRALTLSPGIREAEHFCGPGNTERVLRAAGIEPHIFLDHGSWLAEMGEEEA